MKLVGANRAAKAMALDELPGKVNYFLGNDPAKWRTNVPTYAKVKYRSVYPGIDLVYYGNQRELEYDFAVAPGTDPHVVTIELESGNSTLETRKSKMKITANGDLVIEMPGGEVRFHKPVVYQSKSTVNSRQFTGKNGGDSEFGTQNSEFLDGRYILTSDNRIQFEIPKYDRKRPLVIDPVLSYSTYLGGLSFDQGNGIAVDSSGDAYVTGFTASSNFPTTSGAADASFDGVTDVFVTKLSASGSSAVYSAFLGGSATDQGTAIRVDSSGCAYVTGETFSSNFPTTTGALQTAYNGNGDAFVAKLSADGSTLDYSTYFGGSGLDEALGLALDSSNNIYLTGKTYSTNFPGANALQVSNGGAQDAFVAELSATGFLVYSTYLGGSGYDQGNSIAVDSSGNAYLAGSTTSTNFPTAHPFQASCASCPNVSDAFVAEIGANSSGLVYSTYLGGSGNDQGRGIAVDGSGNAYVTGSTSSTDFPTTSGAFQISQPGLVSAFVAEITANGAGLGYSTYLGGSQYSYGQAIAFLNGNAYVAGVTNSGNFPTVNPIQAQFQGIADAFVSELSSGGSSLYFSTYLGGSSYDEAGAIAVDSSGAAYITGSTRSSNLPLAGAFQGTYGGGDSDAFVSKLGPPPAVTLSPTYLSFPSQVVGTTSATQSVTLSNAASTTLSISSIAITGTNSGDFAQTNNCGASLATNSSCKINVTFTPTATGTRSATLAVTDNATNSPQTAALTGTGASSTGSTGVSLATKASGAFSSGTSTTSAVTSGSFSLPAGDLLVAYCGVSTSTPSTPLISDAAGNTFIQVGTTASGSGGDALAMFYAPNALGNPSDTVTCQWNSAYHTLGVMAIVYSGADPNSPLDASASGYVKAGTTLLTGPFSTSSANEVLVAGMMSGSGCVAAPKPGSGYTTELDAVPSGCGGPVAAAEDETVSTLQTNVTASMTFSSSVYADMIAASFRAASTSTASVTLSPNSLSFGNQTVGTTSSSQAVTLSNSASTALSISSIAIAGTDSSDFAETNNCGTSLAANSSCTINVTFTPSTTGTLTATLTVTDSASNSPQTASLTGTGTSLTVSVSPTSLSFGNQVVNTASAAQTVTLSNTGSSSVSISSIAISGGNSTSFGETNNCGTSLAAGAGCTIKVTFTPTTTGTLSSTLAITDNASGSPQTVSLTGTGTTATSSSLTVVQVQNNIDTTTTAYTSFSVPITTTAGDLLVAFCRESSNGTDNFTVTDSAGQTWTQTASGYKNESSSGPRIGMFYIADSAAVTRVTVNYTTSGGVIKPGIMVMEISGAATSTVADGSVNNGTASSTTTSTSGALTTTNASDILIFATDTSGNETGWTAGTGFTIPNNKVTTGASGSNARMAMQYAITAGALTNTTTSMTYANANWNGNIFAAFK